MKPLSRGVERLLRGLGISDEVAHMDALDAWPSVATAAFGPDGASTTAVRVDGSTLVVATPTSAWASEIRLREADLVARLGAAAPRAKVQRIRVVPARG